MLQHIEHHRGVGASLEAIGQVSAFHHEEGEYPQFEGGSDIAFVSKPGVPEQVRGLHSLANRFFEHGSQHLVLVFSEGGLVVLGDAERLSLNASRSSCTFLRPM